MKNFLSAVCAAIAALTLTADEPRSCRVSITSQPEGASVIIDGKDRGTTPITLFDLAPGRHHLKLRRAGYVERDRFFSTGDVPFVEKSEVLDEVKGILLLKSEPEGANILIDGVSYGQTPRLITALSAKDVYSVKLRKAGYQDQSISVKFEGRKPLVREEKLVLASGVVDIMSEPAGAEVTVNGISRGHTPVKVSGIPRGLATVVLKMKGFADKTLELRVNAGDVQTLSTALERLPGTLHLISVPEGARFYLNGEARGKGPLAITGLTPGDYRVRAELDGFGTTERTITIGNGESAREEFKLSNVMGRLEIRTSPPGSQIFFDGRLLGVTKAQSEKDEFSAVFPIDNVLEGEHSLVVKKDGYAESVRHPKIRNSKTSVANVRLRRIFTPNVEIVTARGEYRGVLVSRTPSEVVLEVSLGITRSFPQSEIRKFTWLDGKK